MPTRRASCCFSTPTLLNGRFLELDDGTIMIGYRDGDYDSLSG